MLCAQALIFRFRGLRHQKIFHVSPCRTNPSLFPERPSNKLTGLRGNESKF